MITLFFWSSRFIFQKAQLCQEREEDVVTRAEAQCLQAVQDFQFSGPEEDLFPARKRGTTDGIYSIYLPCASSCIFRILRTMWMDAGCPVDVEVNRRGKLEVQLSFKKSPCGSM